MLLEKLTISSVKGIIRDIPFKLQGLNLVIDTTPISEDTTISGNNVGKTTFIRSVDFCLGSSGKDIYLDKESGNDNEQVKSFLIDEQVQFTLSLIKRDGSPLVLRRSFVHELDLFIDGVQYRKLDSYNKQLNELFFHIPVLEKSITFRSFIKKFVRSDAASESSIYKVLGSYATDALYEAIYLFLLGFPDKEIIATRLNLIDSIAKNKAALKKMKGVSSLPKLEGRLAQLEKDITEKELLVKEMDLPKVYDELITKLRSLKLVTTDLSNRMANINTRLSFSQKTKDELRHSESKIDPEAIKKLYEEAKSLLDNIQRPFEEVLAFHNKMILNKIKLVEEHIKKLELDRQSLKEELDPLLKQQSHILLQLDNTGTFDDLIKIREDVNDLYVEKGRLVGQIEEIQEVQKQIEELTQSLNVIAATFSKFLGELRSNINDVFNPYFTQFTFKTHGEKLYIYYDDESRKFGFDNIAGNVGDGYKKTEVIAFDLSFINYFNELGLDFPKFVIHDKMEIIHKNQIQSVFEIADSVNGQFIVSVLQERIQFLGPDYINSKKILELSQDKKFFRF